ncbi:MAG: hypothetical protein IAC29_06800 [Bacteroidetes bacterium]|uniref:Uncharacterized protein n=1 Tax=Candidatus Cryptobacteroides merdigallinarum TaxID=2840770 RepID=A0A9D9ELX0_9BACT|nr:hypothetical protein [Candidatus Cryptobacteroides merdigallinarum]
MGKIIPAISAILLSAASSLICAAQEQKEPPTVTEMAATEAERLERLLGLEYWQVFYVDSTLQHDYQAMKDELTELSDAKVSNSSMYIAVQDKWMEKIDSTYRKYFTDAQWKAYLKSGAAKQQKAREKRKVKSEGK